MSHTHPAATGLERTHDGGTDLFCTRGGEGNLCVQRSFFKPSSGHFSASCSPQPVPQSSLADLEKLQPTPQVLVNVATREKRLGSKPRSTPL